MPEFYAEPMKNRKSCSVCKKTAKAKGKKVLLTCIKCHAITYCGGECQAADWGRHEWNCVPVMVTEIPGKGRGLVAARNIEKGEVIFEDESVIKLAMNAQRQFTDPEFMTSLKQQIDSLPTEARAQYYKLQTHDVVNNYNLNRRDEEVFNLFWCNSKMYEKVGGESRLNTLHLNFALVNHSCSPNATNDGLKQKQQKGDEDVSVKLKAIKDICKGEEITFCYYKAVEKFGSNPRKRKTAIKKSLGFECKCPVCLGHVPVQEKTLRKLIEATNKLNPTPSDWKREAGIWSRVVDLTMELNIGDPHEKIRALDALVRFAHLSREKDLLRKAMGMWRQFTKELKIENIQRGPEDLERGLAKWSAEFSLSNAPKKREVDAILRMIQGDLNISV